MEQLREILDLIGGIDTVAIIGIIFACFKAYKTIMRLINEVREAAMAGMNINAVFQKAYADKKLSNDEIKAIQEAIEDAMKEGKDVVNALEEAKKEISVLYSNAKKKKH